MTIYKVLAPLVADRQYKAGEEITSKELKSFEEYFVSNGFLEVIKEVEEETTTQENKTTITKK